MADKLTHYIPPYTVNGQHGTQRAFCNVDVLPRFHSNEPTCPVCLRLLLQDDSDLLATFPELYPEVTK